MAGTFQNLVFNIFPAYEERIRRFTRPLRDHLGMSYFTYHFITKCGEYGAIVDRLDYAEIYVENQYYLEDPYLSAPHNYQNEVTEWGTIGSAEFFDRVRLHGLSQGVMFSQTGADGGVEFYGFAAAHSSPMLHVVLNQRRLLDRFFANFRTHMRPLIERLREEPISLPEVKRERYFEPVKRYDQEIDAFAAALGVAPPIALSKRERACLELYREGLTAAQTGERLGLSPRTVESYFESIKSKLGCDSKRELLRPLP